MKKRTKYNSKEEATLAQKERVREYNRKSRFIVLQFYSATTPFCNCCGEKELKFLSIDHVNGGGNEHRRSMGRVDGKGGNISHWIRKNNFPDGFQVLCHNCNMAKGFYGVCPHKLLDGVL